MKIFANCLGVTLFVFVVAFAQQKSEPLVKQIEEEQAEEDLRKMVRVQVEFIEVPHETMTELLSEPRTSANDTPLRAGLQELVKEGKAMILETQMVTARSGQKAMTESVHEMIYPCEYDMPQVVENNIQDKDQSGVSLPILRPSIPVAWETRNLGSTLEIEPTIGENDKIIDLRLLPTLLYHTGDRVWHEETKGKDTYKIQMPDFYKIQFDTSATLITGQPLLISAVSPKNEKGVADFTKKVLIFVRADVLTVGK